MANIGTWLDVGVANGPGDHSDEASSAWSAVKGVVAPSTARAIASIDHIARPNGASEDSVDNTIGFGVLIPLARMVSGQWGRIKKGMRQHDEKGLSSVERLGASIGSVRSNPRRLPIYRTNPSSEDVIPGAWADEPFWQRMAELREMLLREERSAEAIYARRGIKSRDNQDWTLAFEQCRLDVEWVLSHRREAEAGSLRIVEREGGDVVRVMGIVPSVDWRAANRLSASRLKVARSNPQEVSARRPWGILAAKGNQKLPFVAYSTLPMASCLGAGSCSVQLKDGRKEGYCYSFTAWRYPDSFARQFRNCLAEFVDRELAIIAGGAGDTKPSQWSQRVEAAMSPKGRAARSWHRFVGDMAEAFLMPAIDDGQPAFMRLYVDGDVNSADNILEWMDVCARLQRTRRSGDGSKPSHPGVQVYGYSKCWDQFLELDRRAVTWPGDVVSAKSVEKRGGAKFSWPSNYTLNLSADSVWNNENTASDDDRRRITVAMSELPISRGYFKSIDLKSSLDALNAQFDPATGTLRDFKVPSASETPFPFRPERIRAVVAMNRAMDVSGVRARSGAKTRKEMVAALQASFIEVAKAYELDAFLPKEKVYKGSGEKRVLTGERVRFAKPAGKYEKGARQGAKKSDDDYLSEFSSWLLSQLYHSWFAMLYTHAISGKSSIGSEFEKKYGDFGSVALTELSRDETEFGAKALSPADYLDEARKAKMRDATAEAIKKARAGKGGTLAAAEEAAVRKDVEAKFAPDTFLAAFGRSKAYQSKALAVALHEVLWSFNLGGSCPLVCGNCYDTPTVPVKGTEEYLNARHRCASIAGFKARTIYIGRH